MSNRETEKIKKKKKNERKENENVNYETNIWKFQPKFIYFRLPKIWTVLGTTFYMERTSFAIIFIIKLYDKI